MALCRIGLHKWAPWEVIEVGVLKLGDKTAGVLMTSRRICCMCGKEQQTERALTAGGVV